MNLFIVCTFLFKTMCVYLYLSISTYIQIFKHFPILSIANYTSFFFYSPVEFSFHVYVHSLFFILNIPHILAKRGLSFT